MKKLTAGVIGVASAVAGLAAGYPILARTRCLTWGATAEEAGRALPGDGLLPTPQVMSTRAVTIEATAEKIWPWLVQIGPGRGGAYTYDWIEQLFGLDMHSADDVLPQFQNLAVGDVMPLGESGPRMRVAILDRPHSLVFASEDHNWVWEFVLEPVAATESTRLISRNRIAQPGAAWPARLFSMLVMEPGSLLMERKMLLGIKERAERRDALPVVTKDLAGQPQSLYAPDAPARTL
ncbi:hypothetical protein [Nocardia inohanensis]|uniref:hypothetical protein n=1 Tax=Nocardia inohanensis TaxID=209246 RepID=UPI00082CB580|nr:hypothetical protein [Nocardia inohanensis]